MKLGMIMGDCRICKGTGEEKSPDVPLVSPESATIPEPIKNVDKDIDHGKKEEPKATSKNNKRKR